MEKQLKLFRELMESGEVKDKEELIGRWEELTEFWAAEGAEAAVRPFAAIGQSCADRQCRYVR